jgi:hypothetical protein
MDQGLSLSPAPVNCSFPARVVSLRPVPFPGFASGAHHHSPRSTTSWSWVAYVRACVKGIQTKSCDDEGRCLDHANLSC